MYTEQTNFSIKNVIIQFLFVALFIFILIWLFPLKSDLNKAVESIENSDLTVLTDRIFNENIISMKDAAKSYYTTPRLPKNVGDKVDIFAYFNCARCGAEDIPHMTGTITKLNGDYTPNFTCDICGANG